ncbi:MAG: hypothetical protein Q9223_001878 [Gallowayella weberi]
MAVPRLTPTSDGDMHVPSQSAAVTITYNYDEFINIAIIVILIVLNLIVLRYCAPRCCRITGRWWARHSPFYWCKDFLSDLGHTWSLPRYYPQVAQDAEEGVPLQPLQPRDEQAIWAGNWPERADWEARLSGRTLASDEVTLEGAANETTPPGSMDIVFMREQELSRTRSERETEARENVDIATRGVAPASESRRPHKREETDSH